VRILFLTYSYLPNLGGVERSVANLSARLSAAGHSLTVATHRGSAFPLRYAPRREPALLHLHVPSQDRSALWRRAATALLNRWNELVLLALCLFQRVEIVHAHHLNADTGYGRVLSRWLGIPFVITLRGGETEEWVHVNSRRAGYLAENLAAADAVTAVSRALIADAVKIVPALRDRAVPIVNPVDPQAIAAAASEGESLVAPYLLFAGRLEPMKDLECLIEGYHAILATAPDFGVDLAIAGEGSLAGALRELAAAGAGAERIRFLGARSYPETLRLIRDASALVLPSRCSEGCPNVVLEAMALGTPVIVSDLDSLTEIVEDTRNGRVFPVGDREALARVIVGLLGDDAERDRLAVEAHVRLLRSHSFDAVLDAYLALYRELIDAKTSCRRSD